MLVKILGAESCIEVAKSCFVPVLFGHAVDDNFIQPHHSDRICDVYMIEAGEVKKQYIARVIGAFPENEELIVQPFF